MRHLDLGYTERLTLSVDRYAGTHGRARKRSAAKICGTRFLQAFSLYCNPIHLQSSSLSLLSARPSCTSLKHCPRLPLVSKVPSAKVQVFSIPVSCSSHPTSPPSDFRHTSKSYKAHSVAAPHHAVSPFIAVPPLLGSKHLIT